MFLGSLQNIGERIKSSRSIKASLLLIFWMFASRGLGVFRTALVGELSTVEADIFNSGLVLQSNIITIFILGSIVIATLPQLNKLEHGVYAHMINEKSGYSSRSGELASAYLSWCMLILSALIVSICGLLMLFASPVLTLLNPELAKNLISIGKFQEFVLFNQIALVGPVVFALKSLFGVFLNVKKEYRIYSIEGVLNNLGSLLGLTLGYAWFGIVGASVGALLGLSLALLGFALDAWRLGFRFRLGWFPGLGAYLWLTLWLYLPRLLIYSNIRLSETTVSLISDQANGQISALQYALDIQGIFLGVIASVGTVFLPNLAETLVKQGQTKVFWQHFLKYLKISCALGLVGALLTIFGTPIALNLFKLLIQLKPTSFLANQANLQLISDLAIYAGIALVFQAVAEILTRYFTATEKVWQSIVASLVGNCSAIILTVWLVHLKNLGSGQIAALGLLLNTLIFMLILGFFTYRDWLTFKLKKAF